MYRHPDKTLGLRVCQRLSWTVSFAVHTSINTQLGLPYPLNWLPGALGTPSPNRLHLLQVRPEALGLALGSWEGSWAGGHSPARAVLRDPRPLVVRGLLQPCPSCSIPLGLRGPCWPPLEAYLHLQDIAVGFCHAGVGGTLLPVGNLGIWNPQAQLHASLKQRNNETPRYSV